MNTWRVFGWQRERMKKREREQPRMEQSGLAQWKLTGRSPGRFLCHREPLEVGGISLDKGIPSLLCRCSRKGRFPGT